MTHEQRAVWVDLLTVAAKDDGYIRADEGLPYPMEKLTGFLQVPESLLIATIERCLEKKKLTRMPDGTLYITKWDDFKLTPRYRRMVETQSQSDDWAAKKTKELETAKNPKKEE